MRFDVLVVEDESALLRAITRGLEEDPTLAVHGVGDVDAALAVLERAPPDLVLTDLRLPGRSGIDLIAEMERRFPGVPVVVMTAEWARFQQDLASRTGLVILEKPVPLDALRRVVRDGLRDGGPTDRRTGPFGILEYLQLASLGHHSLRIEGQLADQRQVLLEVVEGELWNVRVGSVLGGEALAALVDQETRSVRFDRLSGRPATRQLVGSTEGLLLDAAARRDEARRGPGGDLPVAGSTRRTTSARSAAGKRLRVGPLAAGANEAAADGACRAIVEGLPGARACGALVFSSQELIGYSGPDGDRHAALGGSSLRALADLFEGSSPGGAALTGEAQEEAHLVTAAGQLFCRRIDGSDLLLALITGSEVRPGVAWLALREVEAGAFCAPARRPPEVAAEAPHELAPLPVYAWEAVHRACAGLLAATPAATWCGVIDPGRLAIAAYSGVPPEEVESSHRRVLRAVSRVIEAPAGPPEAVLPGLAEELWIRLPEAAWFVRRLDPAGRYVALATRPEVRPGPLALQFREAAETLRHEVP